MKRDLTITADGSHTLTDCEKQVTYHSIHGAIQESRHVFIEAGLTYVLSQPTFNDDKCIQVFEMGLGTGLNLLLSFKEIKSTNHCLFYHSVELYPLAPEEAAQLNYVSWLNDKELAPIFLLLHQSLWNEDVPLSSFFTFHKSHISLLRIEIEKPFHLIYFDAFAPDVQPELWQPSVFKKLHNMLCEGGVLVTYCSKGSVKRALQETGFVVEKLKGPPGKREMIRAVRKQTTVV